MSAARRARVAAAVRVRPITEALEGRVLLAAELAVELNPQPADAGVSFPPLARIGDRVMFIANDGIHGTEPWVSDGTAAGTMLAADVTPGFSSSSFVPVALMAAGKL